jgi:Flp pilus assembly protein TadG
MILKRFAHRAGFRKDERGSMLVEFGLSIGTVLFVIFMIIEMCSAIYTYTVLSEAANEGVRYAIVHSWDTAGAKNRVKAYAADSLHDMSGMSDPTVTYPDGQTVPGRVRITVSYQYVPYLGFMTNPPTMHAYAEGRLVY